MAAIVGRFTLVLVVMLVLGATITVVAYRVIDARQAPPIVIADAALERPIVVMVDGAVGSPGTFQFPAGARLQHAVDQAGGLLTDADRTDLNLARLLVDGERITVPHIDLAPTATASAVVAPVGAGEVAPAEPVDETPVPPIAPTQTVMAAGELININAADAATLETLPGIGPALADRIIAYRNEHGAFTSVDDLDAVSGISARMVDELRALITV